MKIIIIFIVFIIGQKVYSDYSVLLSENIVARTILVEAGGEGYDGMHAVACVIQQRSIERNKTPMEVCLEPKQFSCWNKATKQDKEIKCLSLDNRFGSDQKDYALFLAKKLVSGENLDRKRVGFANHYHSIDSKNKLANGTVVVIGNHLFFRL